MSRKLALLIGNSTYGPGLPPLEKPDADIAALTKVLSDPAIGGFDEVKPLLDASSAIARREIARFFFGRSPDDLLLLYFSGHGLRNDRGSLYLAVQDTEAELLSATAVPAAFISEEMDNCRSRRQILILDCCYSGAFERGAKGLTGNPAAAFHGNGLGRFVLTASDSTQLAWEDVAANSKGGLSVFTRHLVAGLASGEADLDGDGFVTVDELYDYVYARVVEENPRQTPGKSASKQQGEIFLAHNPTGPRRHPLPTELTQALIHPLAAVREGAVRELGRYLHGTNENLTKAAREAAEQARNDDSRKVALAAAEVLGLAASAPAEPLPPKPSPKPPPKPQPAPAAAPPKAPLPQAQPVLSASKPAATRSRWFLQKVGWRTVIAGVGAGLFILAINSGWFDKTDAPQVPPAPLQVTPAPLQMVSLAEAKSWPLLRAESFDSPSKDFLVPSRSVTLSSGTSESVFHLDSQDDRTASISSGALHLSFAPQKPGGGMASFPVLPATIVTNFYLKVDLKQTQGSRDAGAGLIFRAVAPEAFVGGSQQYAFTISKAAYSLRVGTDKWLKPPTPSEAIHPGQINTLAVIAVGPHLVLYINDKEVAEVDDDARLAYGGVGFAIETHDSAPASFDFDNFELRSRPSKK